MQKNKKSEIQDKISNLGPELPNLLQFRGNKKTFNRKPPLSPFSVDGFLAKV